MGGRGASSASSKPYYSKEERAKFAKGRLPASLPGSRYENELKKSLNEIADNYVRSKDLQEYIDGSFDNGTPHLRVNYQDGSAYVQLGNMSARVNFPDDYDLSDKQKQALVDVYVYQLYKNGKNKTDDNGKSLLGESSNKKSQSDTSQTISLDQFLAQRGLSSPISDYTLDKTRIPHGETQRQKKAREQETLKRAREYSAQRRAAINEYENLVKEGKIKKPSKIDELRAVARGNPDNASVQAARRLLKKRELSW